MLQTAESAAGSGISRELARLRAATIRDPGYRLELAIPASPESPVTGTLRLDFSLTRGADWPLIDFDPGHERAPPGDSMPPGDAIGSLRVNGRESPFAHERGHIRILADPPAPGRQRIEIDFVADPASLHRRPGLVHSLFVPALAHKTFPCFDQPDLKARLRLTLEIPADWQAVANAPERERTTRDGRLRLRFAATEPLPTYLFAFAAGQLVAESRTTGKRTLRLCYPAASPPSADARDAIFALHAAALDELESYTGIDYPFGEPAFVLIPDFPFGGMEHAGAIFYRQSLLTLGNTAGTAERVRHAHLIAHETAHQWFGNLVTMPWFDDVWLKEVFANRMADRIVATAFPGIDHELGFVLRHWPPALAIDRTAGTHAIRQPLDNLAEAGELYDALIYHKASIAMAVLEREIGAPAMQCSLRRYLGEHAFANAGWPELRRCLERESGRDLGEFSRRWIESAGRPVPAPLRQPIPEQQSTPEQTHPDGHGLPAYGFAALDAHGREQALERLTHAARPLDRAVAWITLYEDMLEGGIEPTRLLTAAVALLATESDALLTARVLDDLAEIYWRFLEPTARSFAASPVERVIGIRARSTPPSARDGTEDGSCLERLARFACSEAALAELEVIWRGTRAGGGTDSAGSSSGSAERSEPLLTRIALTLALHRPERAEDILDMQLARTRDADGRARLAFLRPAVSPDPATRDAFFGRLIAGEGRGLWAVAGCALLCHPLRADAALACLERGLDFADALRRRGDIFLPRQWLTALLSGQGTPAAAAAVHAFLARPGIPPRLRQLILQTADPVFRAARIRGGE